MSATKAAELIVHHTQAASYHQGRESVYAEVMRLVRQVRQRLDAQGALSPAAYEELARFEEIMRDRVSEVSRRRDAHNKVLREVSETLAAAS